MGVRVLLGNRRLLRHFVRRAGLQEALRAIRHVLLQIPEEELIVIDMIRALRQPRHDGRIIRRIDVRDLYHGLMVKARVSAGVMSVCVTSGASQSKLTTTPRSCSPVADTIWGYFAVISSVHGQPMA